MRSILRDLKYSLRVLGKSPAFTAIAILSLALGIGPNTAIFSVVNEVLLRGPEGENPETLVDIYNLGDDGDWYFSGFWLVERLRNEGDAVLDGVAAWVTMPAAVDDDGISQPVLFELVTGNYFQVLGLQPERGRFFLPEEDATPGTHPVAVVSHGYWENELGADPGAVGSEIRVNARPYIVIGVAPEGFTGKALPGVQADLWLPYNMYPHLAPGQPTSGNLGITARVAPGVEMATALAALDALGARIDADRKARGREDDFTLGVFPWSEIYLHPTLDGPLIAIAGLLLAVVGLVLLVACINLASFLLARATDRRREVAVRLAMGAGRGAIVRQLMVESVVLGIGGGVVGLGLGLWTARFLTGLDLPIPIPLAIDVGLDGPVLLFTAGASLIASVLFGLTPALQASRSPVASVLRDEGTAVVGNRGKVGLRGLLVAGQMALSVVLLVAAGLFIRSLQAANAVDTGFDTGPAAVLQIQGGSSGYESATDLEPVLRRALEDLESRPEVREAALITRMPLDLGTWVSMYDVPGVPPPEGRDNHRLEFTSVSPGYFSTMDVQLLEGRGFTPEDDTEAPPVVVVSRALAQRFWPRESAVGRTLIPVSDRENPVTVIGVVEDVKIWSLQEEPRSYLYRPYRQSPATTVHLVLRGGASPEDLGRVGVEALARQDPDLFVAEAGSMADHLSYILFLPRMGASLIGAFALLALILSSIGLYGVVSYGVARRTREVGIRMSLGAARGDVLGLVVRGGIGLAGVGAGVGVLLSLGVASILGDYLIQVSPWDPVTLVGVPLLLLAVATLAAFIPARRASRVDPIEALRTD